MRWGLIAAVGVALVVGATPVFADEPEAASLKADIEMLKDRLAQLEGRLEASTVPPTGAEGISSIGEKAGLPTINLPSGLQDIQISGYADISYVYNFAESDPSRNTAGTAGAGPNRGRVFDSDNNGFTPHAFELVVEKPLSDSSPIGFRTDLFFGDDAELIHSAGLPTIVTAAETENFDLQQAYVTARAPIGSGIDFKVGKFVTLLGAEVIESPANWNFSRSYMFGYAIPFTHTGALASYALGEWGSVTGGVVNGWDIVDDTNKAKSLMGNVTLTPLEGVTVSLNGITGAEQAGNSRDRRTVLDLVTIWEPIEKLTLMANYDYGFESAGKNVAAFDTKNWTGLALYAKYDLSDTWSLAGRWEWFDDKDNFRTGYTSIGGGTPTDIDFYEYTLTSQWTLHEHMLARLEYRHDKSDERIFFHDADGFTDYQDTIAAELIMHF